MNQNLELTALWIPVVITLIGALVTTIGTIVAWVSKQKSERAFTEQAEIEADKLRQDMSLELANYYKADFEEMRYEIKSLKQTVNLHESLLEALEEKNSILRKDNQILWEGILSLLGQIEDYDTVPNWKPPIDLVHKYKSSDTKI